MIRACGDVTWFIREDGEIRVYASPNWERGMTLGEFETWLRSKTNRIVGRRTVGELHERKH